jgi:hypothetical protein
VTAARGRLGDNLEQLGDEGGLSLHVTPIDLPNLAFSDHRHRLVARQHSSRRAEAFEAKAWSDEAFRTPMILLDDVVQELGSA